MSADSLDICPSCNGKGMPWVYKGETCDARRCNLCGHIQDVTEEMKIGEDIRPKKFSY